MKARPLRVLVADDEEIARKRMVRLLKSVDGVELAGECSDGVSVLKVCARGEVDVLLLDIQMPGLTGLEAKALLADGAPYVIFCTAHAEHAVDAFEVGAVDYLLKPIALERLAKALERARSRASSGTNPRTPPSSDETPSPSPPGLLRLAIPTREGVMLVDPAEITHAVLDGELVTVHVGDKKYLADFSLQGLLDKLPGRGFERVHRRAVLNLAHVARLEPCPSGGYIARTHRGHEVEVSRQAARALRKRLGLRAPAAGDERDHGSDDDADR